MGGEELFSETVETVPLEMLPWPFLVSRPHLQLSAPDVAQLVPGRQWEGAARGVLGLAAVAVEDVGWHNSVSDGIGHLPDTGTWGRSW